MYETPLLHRNEKGAASSTKMIVYVVLAGIAALLVIVAILNWGRHSMATSASGFIRQATIGNEFEVRSSQLALSKTRNEAIRQFAQRMVDDHSKAAQDLSSVASTIPNVGSEMAGAQLDSEHTALLDKLSGATGQDFDEQYVKDQVKAHDDAVNLFKSYAGAGDNQALKDFASRTLPVLQSHQHDIDQINSTSLNQ